MREKYVWLILGVAILISACGSGQKNGVDAQQIEIYDASLTDILKKNARIEVLARGFEWAEGPLWLPSENCLVFSDVPANIAYRWNESEGLSTYLDPSGFTRLAGTPREGGSNGLALNPDGELVLCQHGDRRIAIMDAPLNSPCSRFRTLASHYDSLRFNSPNDLVYHSSGDLYFTDPPYGLDGQDDDEQKEIPFSGVYRRDTHGSVTLLIDSLTRPNGIAFSPDDQTMYVAQSDPAKAWWLRYAMQNGRMISGGIFYDATVEASQEQGLPDGLKVHPSGRIFATGPGGVWIFDREGAVLGKIRTAQASANCAFDNGYRHLYITSDSLLLRVALD